MLPKFPEYMNNLFFFHVFENISTCEASSNTPIVEWKYFILKKILVWFSWKIKEEMESS